MSKKKAASPSLNRTVEHSLPPPVLSSTPQDNQPDWHVISPTDLRLRRGLNTTPDSSLSSIPSGRVRTRSATYGTGDLSTPLVKRHWEHVYTRVETIRPGDFSSEEAIRSKQYKPPATIFKQWNKILSVALLCLFFYLLYIRVDSLLIQPLTSPKLSSSMVPLHSLTDELAMEFPNQTKRFWTQLRAALERHHRVSWSSVTPVASEMMPAIILFVNRVTSTFSDTTNLEPSNLFYQFISRFGLLASSFVLRQQHPLCPRVDDLVTLDPTSLVGDTAENAGANLKLRFDNELQRLYDNGTRCFYFPSLDRLPPEVVLLFHGVADSQNSVYRDVLLLFSLETTFDLDNSSHHTEQSISEHRRFEHSIQRHLRTLWTPSLGSEETDALLSRLTPNVAVFHTIL